MKVEVIRSARRRKTVQARQLKGVVRVYIPASMSLEDERHWVSEMLRRMERRGTSAAIDLPERTRNLASTLGLQEPASIRWVDNQGARWGSCTPSSRTIRISSRLAREPLWVLDYVIVHELAHLTVPGHGPRFWALVDRYRLAERARGFLMARGMEEDEAGEGDGEDTQPQVTPASEPRRQAATDREAAVAAGMERPRRPAAYRQVASRRR